ncbi:protein containing conserved repeat domain [Anaerolinea thermolimosa]|uniref:Protein containing conserved repeat domain n=2 Tax=Anaerolinea thermolimosa TaxID=229919 RepID=A0A7U9KMI8_9CHLR|nr:protein containing conserved repeat domain [Anaerolinea thermolimosa]
MQGGLLDGYLKISGTAAFDGSTPGAGLTTQTLQIHGLTDQYALAGGVKLASLYSDATASTSYPAVVGNLAGSGRAVAFLYDLGKNIVLTRQGDPANAGIDVDGDGVVRAFELFWKWSGDHTTRIPWVNLDRVPVPQADEQMRLFSRLVRQLANQPLPQLWYFPGSTRTMLVLTGDAHANPTAYYQQEINSLNAYGARMTFYLVQAGEPTNANVQAWRAQGHEFGIHPYASKPDVGITNIDQGYAVFNSWFGSTFSSPKSRTVRNHQVAWKGYTDAVELERDYGIAMDTNFYHSGAWLQKADGTWAHGYITGSGLPMKFSRTDGTILPVYQQETHLVDEQLIRDAGVGREGLTAEQGVAVSRALIDASQNGFYSALMTQFHVDYYGNGDPRGWAEGTMAYAQSLGIPLWNADRWLAFTETRHDAVFQNIVWDQSTGRLTFDLFSNPDRGEGLTVLLPASWDGRPLEWVQVDAGAPLTAPFSPMDVRGVPMVFFPLSAGSHSWTVSYLTAHADLQVGLEAPSTVNAGGRLTFRLTITNAGPDLSENVVASLTVPAGTTGVGVEASQGSCTPGVTEVSCNLGNLSAGSGATIDLTLTAPAEPTTLSSQGHAASAVTPDWAPGNNSASREVSVSAVSDLALTLTDVPDPVLAGRPLSYTVQVVNAGPSTAGGVQVRLTLPAGAQFNQAAGSGWNCTWGGAGQEVLCGLSQPVGAGESAPPLGVGIFAPASGTSFQTVARVSSVNFDPQGENNEVVAVTTLRYALFLPLISRQPFP